MSRCRWVGRCSSAVYLGDRGKKAPGRGEVDSQACSSRDLVALQEKALVERITYQTVIASVLHKYAAGRLREEHAWGSIRMGEVAGRAK